MSRERSTQGQEDLRTAIAFHAGVLGQIRRWHQVGIIDAPTRDNLMRYERSQIATATQVASAPRPALELPAQAAPAPQPRVTEPARPTPTPRTSPRRPAATPAAPREDRPRPLPLPQRPESQPGSSLAVVGHFLRERTWWLVGAALTVLGSFFVAGTIWSDLGTGPRLAVVLVGLGVYAQAFAVIGHRLARQEGGERAGRWLVGVSVALAPVLAMAAGSGWSLGGWAGLAFGGSALVVVALLMLWRLPRDLPLLLPESAAPFRRIYLLLSLGVGLLPLAPSPAWLLLPAVIAAGGLWWALTRWQCCPTIAGLLLLHPLAFHAYLAPHGWSGAYAPTIAAAALAVLYLDAAMGRWRGVHALRLRGVRGVAALALAGLALLLLLPGFDFLPSGPESAITGLLLVPFFLGAALCWRRPVLIHGALLAALIFTLALPDLFWAMVEPFLLLAGAALGYSDEPLPIAWYSLTLLPYLLVCRLAAGALRRSGWRQAEAISAHVWGWTFTLSLALLLVAHSRLDDLRPALLSLPLHGALWLREHRVRNLVSGTLPWVGLTVWTVDLLWYLGAAPELRLAVGAAVVLALIPMGAALARKLGERSVLTGARIVAVPAALAVPLLVAGWEAPILALAVTGATTWIVSLSLRPLGAAPTENLYRLETLLAVWGQALLIAGGIAWGLDHRLEPLGWAASMETVALAALALAWWLPRRRQRVAGSCLSLHVHAHTLAVAAVIALMFLGGLERSLMKLPVALMLVWWLRNTHWRIYGGLLVFGVAESVLRRLWMADVLEPGSLAVIATTLCWLPTLVLIASKRAVPRFGAHWLHRSLGQPAAWLGAVAAVIALPLILLQGAPGLESQIAAIALTGMLLLASQLAPRWTGAIEGYAWAVAIAAATTWALGEPLPMVLPWLTLLPVGLGLLGLWRHSDLRRGATITAMGAALLVMLVTGPLEQPQLLAAVAVAASLVALRHQRGFTEAALVAWVALAHLLLERSFAPGIVPHLITMSTATLLLWGIGRARTAWPRLGAAAWRTGLAMAMVSAAAWAAWAAWLGIQQELVLQPLGLVAATILLWAYRHGATARLLAPWALSACLLSLGAPALLHPLTWLAFAALAWLLSARKASDRVGTRLIGAGVAVGLLVVSINQPETRPVAAFAFAAVGLLITHTGTQHRWAWGGLAAGLVCAAALTPVEPVAVVLRSALAFTTVASLIHLAPKRGRLPPQALLWMAVAMGLGVCAGTWTLTSLALTAGGLLLVRSARGESTRGPDLLEEPAGWLLLMGSVALRIWDQGGTAEWFLLAAAIPALAWGLKRPWLFLASLPLLAWLPSELPGLDFTVAWPATLAVLALLGWTLRAHLPGGRHAALLCLGLGSATALLTLLDAGASTYAGIAVVLATGWWLVGLRSIALLQLTAGLGLMSWDLLGLDSGLPALVLLLAVPAARKLEARWLEVLCVGLLVPAVLVDGVGQIELDSSGWQQMVLFGALALSLARTARQDDPSRWYATAAWGALLYMVLRIDGPLAHLPPKLELPLLVGLGLVLECAALALERSRGTAWVQPLRHSTLAIAGLALLGSLFTGGATSIGVALAGCLLCLRWVLRERWQELVLGVILLDIATVMIFVKLDWTEPLAWIGPTGLSLLVLAQVLRQSLDPRIRDLLRYAGACCIYVTALGQAVFDPGWTLGLVLLSLAGLALGSLLRVRALLYLGTGFLASALLTELLRFGLNHSGFWAFYLTTIGLAILASMVALTLLRPQLATMRGRWRERMEEWE